MTGPGMPYVGRGNGGSVVDDGIVGRRSSDVDMMTVSRQFVKISIVIFLKKNDSFQFRFRQSWSRRTLSETERDREFVRETSRSVVFVDRPTVRGVRASSPRTKLEYKSKLERSLE